MLSEMTGAQREGERKSERQTVKGEEREGGSVKDKATGCRHCFKGPFNEI